MSRCASVWVLTLPGGLHCYVVQDAKVAVRNFVETDEQSIAGAAPLVSEVLGHYLEYHGVDRRLSRTLEEGLRCCLVEYVHKLMVEFH
jgi:hypothetical protein